VSPNGFFVTMNGCAHVLKSTESVSVGAARSSEATDESECTGTRGRRFPALAAAKYFCVGPSTGNSQIVHNFSTSPFEEPRWYAERAPSPQEQVRGRRTEAVRCVAFDGAV
jgi:hypothetical protein